MTIPEVMYTPVETERVIKFLKDYNLRTVVPNNPSSQIYIIAFMIQSLWELELYLFPSTGNYSLARYG